MKKTVLTIITLVLVLQAHAQAVIFPQEQQAGTAQVSSADNVFTLSNDLLSASFRVADGTLVFDGCKALGLNPGTELFRLVLGNGTEVSASQMTMGTVRTTELAPDETASKGALRLPGKAIEADFTYRNLSMTWRAVLRDGSHYLRTELTLSAAADVTFKSIIPMIYAVDNASSEQPPAVVGNTRGAVIASDHIFAGLETPMGKNTIVSDTPLGTFVYDAWTGTTFSWTPASATPQGIRNLGLTNDYISGIQGYLAIKESGSHKVTFQYTSGRHRLDIAGVDVVDLQGTVVAHDYHKGYTGGSKSRNVYTLNIPEPGYYLVRYFRDMTEELTGIITPPFNSNGTITWSGTVSAPEVVYDGGENDLTENVVHLPVSTETAIQGEWSRQTTLAAGKTWKVSAVVGLIAPGQARRSFLCYSERERAVPWRPFPIYNSWFELNINRNNDANYTTNFNEAQCEDVLDQWKTNLFDKYGVGIGSFVWDDGWDEYGTWQFNPNFPNGFQSLSDKAWAMNSQIGAWLGPVGGYGQSGTYRRNYWSSRGGMQLSNPAYYDIFLDRTSYMLNTYHFNFFKFDGISAQFSATGPDAGSTGEENAEGIIDIELKLREVKPDLFINTTVGTWASPFWFQVTDAVWRQENDWGTAGDQGNTREQWITYRDRLVYQNFVQNSPLCPINTLMTHGFILTKYGGNMANMSKSYNDIVREMRCAFACGSGMVEIYADYALMNSISGGKLWGELAECIKWQEAQKDVLPDVHWVGGDPWDGSKANVYGWAAWNGPKATLALRNPAASRQTFTTTLREAFDIPDYIHTSITLTDAFKQNALRGLTTGEPIDIDTPLTLSLAASSVYIFNGSDIETAIHDIGLTPDPSPVREGSAGAWYDLGGRKVHNGQLKMDRSALRDASHVKNGQLLRGFYIHNGKKVIIK